MSDIVTGDRLISYLKDLAKKNTKIFVPSDSDHEVATGIIPYLDSFDTIDAGSCAKHFVKYKAQATVRVIDMAEELQDIINEAREIENEKKERLKLLSETKKRMQEWKNEDGGSGE